MSLGSTTRSGGLPAYGNIQEAAEALLTERECSIFNKGLNGYHQRGDVSLLVNSLSTVLNTNQKRQLLVPIRDAFVKPSDVFRFNSLAVKCNLGQTREGTKKRETKERERKFLGARKIDVKRDSVGEWGFSIRGGSEHGTGIFVSWVDPGSHAQKAGLQAGDQILKVNETSFEGISHFEATQVREHFIIIIFVINFIYLSLSSPSPLLSLSLSLSPFGQTLRGCRKARLWLKLQGKIPGGIQYATRSYRWVNAEGRQVSPPPVRFELPDTGSPQGTSTRLDPDERKVSLLEKA